MCLCSINQFCCLNIFICCLFIILGVISSSKSMVCHQTIDSQTGYWIWVRLSLFDYASFHELNNRFVEIDHLLKDFLSYCNTTIEIPLNLSRQHKSHMYKLIINHCQSLIFIKDSLITLPGISLVWLFWDSG